MQDFKMPFSEKISKKIRTKTLKMKNGLSEDSPKQMIYEYSGFLRVKENELMEFAEKLVLYFVE